MGSLQKMGPRRWRNVSPMGTGLKGLAGGLTAFGPIRSCVGSPGIRNLLRQLERVFIPCNFPMGGALGKFADGLKAIGDVDGSILQVAQGTLALSEQWWQWQVEVV